LQERKQKLQNGLLLPAIGFGTWLLSEGEEVRKAVIEAIDAGYRLIDTAAQYGNEKGIGKAVGESGLDRKDVLITTKLAAETKGYEETLRAFEASLKRLDTNYVDLYLIHSPVPWGARGDGMEYMEANIASWRAMEDLYRERRIRAIGVSNFEPVHLDALLAEADIAPMVNQIEINPFHEPKETIAYCQAKDIVIQAYSPLAQGRVFSARHLEELATEKGRTIAQVVLRWHYQKGFLPVPKSKNAERIKENIGIFDFELDAKEMKRIG